jgi:hypothetical protein
MSIWAIDAGLVDGGGAAAVQAMQQLQLLAAAEDERWNVISDIWMQHASRGQSRGEKAFFIAAA